MLHAKQATDGKDIVCSFHYIINLDVQGKRANEQHVGFAEHAKEATNGKNIVRLFVHFIIISLDVQGTRASLWAFLSMRRQLRMAKLLFISLLR